MSDDLFSYKADAIVDASSLGEMREIWCTESGATVACERGELRLSPDQFFALSRVLSRPTKESRP